METPLVLDVLSVALPAVTSVDPDTVPAVNYTPTIGI